MVVSEINNNNNNVDSKAEYSALSSTRSRKKYIQKEKTKTNKRQCPFNSVQVHSFTDLNGVNSSTEGIRVTMKEGLNYADLR